jgi:Leucine-rich repeat (LRR) protein
MNSVPPKLLTQQEINERFDLSPYDLIGDYTYDAILFFDGDTFIDGDLDKDRVTAFLQELKEERSLDSMLVFVNGNLTVNGQVGMGDYHPFLLVLGNVHCEVLYSSDDTMYIKGDAHVKYAYYGYYNDGSITVDGTTYVPYVLNSDHHSAITPQGAILINVYSDHNDFFEYDYTCEVLDESVVPDALDDNGGFDAWKFIDVVKQGQSPFKEGVKPLRLVYEEELEHITSGNTDTVVELDYSDKKLKVFPPSLAKLKKLKKLTLSKNIITEIPAIIGELESLEELDLSRCNIETINEAIGKLKKLRILNLSSNHNLGSFPEAMFGLSELQVLKMDYVATPLPEGLAKLEKLEELRMYQCYNDKDNVAPFPEVITKLKNLKHFDFRENLIKELPVSFENVQTLESFIWTGGRTQSPVFPDFRRFPNLKKLVISRKFNSWQNRLFDLSALEHLEIDRNKEERESITQDMFDMWVQMAEEKNDDAWKKRLQWMQENKIEESNGKFSIITAPGMKWEDLADINRLQNLRYLDLSFNHLPALPETFYELKNLKYLDVRYNKFSNEVEERIKAVFRNTEIIWK